MSEIIFIVEEDPSGGHVAYALGESIVTQAETIDELKENIRDAINCHFENSEDIPIPSIFNI
jgi:predicted RNase H-like HicB family nuclease